MSCNPPVRTIRTKKMVITSRGTGGTLGASDVWVLSPDDISEIAPLLVQARVTIIVEHISGATGNTLTQAVLQSTDDGMLWNTAVGTVGTVMAGEKKRTATNSVPRPPRPARPSLRRSPPRWSVGRRSTPARLIQKRPVLAA